MKRILLASLIMLVGLAFYHPASADSLPPATWYAVVWNTDSDTLHWLNANGEQASIPRPKLDDEFDNGRQWVHISRNGKTMVVGAEIEDGRWAVGFYDFTTDKFMVQHVAATGEIALSPGRYGSNLNSNRVAISFFNPQTEAWRVLDFDFTTGGAFHQLKSDDANAPDIPLALVSANMMPYVQFYDLDEGLGQNVVHIQFRGSDAKAVHPTYKWYPELDPGIGDAVGESVYFYDSIDFDLPARHLAYTYNDNANAPDDRVVSEFVGAPFETIYQEQGTTLSNATWLNSGQWIGVYRWTDAIQPQWLITAPNTQPIPLGPNIVNVAGTPDGYLAVDTTGGKIFHVTQFDVEGFSPAPGNQIFDAGGAAALYIVYVTPHFNTFDLARVGDNTVVDGPDNVVAQPASDCDNTQALAPRMIVGQTGRVTFTNGAALNVRATANGDLVTQIAEGTIFDVVGGPQCVAELRWYQIKLANNVIGWAAEGSGTTYFMEPFKLDGLVIVTPVPTINGGGDIIQAQPTATPPLVIQVQPTATLPQVILTPNCSNAPTSYLQVGLKGKVVNLGGTLAMRNNVSDQFPVNQLPAGTLVQINEGPQCNATGLRMWKVSATLNGQTVNGWVADGSGATQYIALIP